MSKYIFITGGVVSSLGKGLTAASMAMLLESRGYKVAMLKLDPYLNVDPGTMNPFQHGEVYVTDDGAETDLDLGHYFRFTHTVLTKNSNTTSGQVYHTVIKKERHGDYLGNTVQVIPHITDEIKHRIRLAANHDQKPDITFVEIGGTVGDIESLPFLEAIRQFRLENPQHCMNIHLTYVPYLTAAQELKTKPTQHSVQTLRGIGVIPDLIICRCDNPLPQELKEKIALFCSVPQHAVIDAPNVKTSLYEVPLILKQSGLDELICKFLGLSCSPSSLQHWEALIAKAANPKSRVTVGLVGKYVQHKDAYMCVFEALEHAGIHFQTKVLVKPFDSDKLTEEPAMMEELKACDGVVIPGGFGVRGWIGKIQTARYCRESSVPYLGLCLGMQVMAVEFARNVLHLEDANSTEMDPETKNPIISLLSEQKHVNDLGGTMRLGAYECHLKRGSKAHSAYEALVISERHRHRYEFNNLYEKSCEASGLLLSGRYEKQNLCEILELKDHPWMVGVQFHPEFKSKLTEPHPLFKGFIQAVLQRKGLT
ncbi:MAG: CTP synthase [Chlamydiae bacterium]|nr:CTP synthase [Chlamydiota bacterium]